MHTGLLVLGAWVQARLAGELSREAVIDIAEAAISLAHEKGLNALLFLSGRDDASTLSSFHDALRRMRELGALPPFRIAFVAFNHPQFEVYRSITKLARSLGLDAKLFVLIREARDWLCEVTS